MGYNDRIWTCNVGEGVYLYPYTSNIIESQKIIWKKVYYTKAEIDKEMRRSPLDRMLFPKDIGGTFVDENNDKKPDKAYPLVYYTFKKGDEGKYIKFYAMLNGYVHSDQGVAFYVNTPLSANVLVRKVIVNKSNFKVGEQIKLSVEYNTPYDKVPQKTKENVKWKVRVENTDTDLVIDGSPKIGEKIFFNIPSDWEGKEVILMPYLNKWTPNYSAKIDLTSETKNYIVIPSTGKIELDHSRPKQTDRYRINNRNSSEDTIRKLKGELKLEYIVSKTIGDIVLDYNSNYSTGFPDHYYEICGKRMLVHALLKHRSLFKKNAPRILRVGVSLSYICELIDGDKGFCNGEGAPLFHIYENVVRKNDDTGLDKLLHFLYSAKWAFLSKGVISKYLGYAKEFFLDEVPSWVSDDIGWDDKDIEANRRGIAFGNSLKKQNK
ncbi:MAG: hypothetical protein ACK5KT_05975 [Dysgonomonas sp.]